MVLHAAGSCDIESFSGGRWRAARYVPGALGLTRPGGATRLRWRGEDAALSLHVHLPASTMQEVAAQLAAGGLRREPPDALDVRDAAVAALLTSLRRAARARAPELYAETMAHALAAQLVLRKGEVMPPPPRAGEAALKRVDERLRSALATALTLEDLATAAGLTRFQLLREAKAGWGETPMRRLTRLRMELARRLLAASRLSILEVALECGYGGSAHFATAFRKHAGVTPSAYRRGGGAT